MSSNLKHLLKATTNTQLRNLAAGYLQFFKPSASRLAIKDMGICFGASSVNVSAELKGERKSMYATFDKLHAYQNKEALLFERIEKVKQSIRLNPSDEINPSQREALDIAVYLENMIIHHLPIEQRDEGLYGSRISQGYLHYYHLHGDAPMPTQVVHRTLAPTPDELIRDFRDFSSRRDNRFGRVAMILCSPDHAISIAPEGCDFHFFDINQLSVDAEGQHQPRILSAADTQEAVFCSFLDEERTLFNLQAFATPSFPESSAQPVFFNVPLNPSSVTRLTNHSGETLLFSSAKHEDLKTLKAITHLPNDEVWPENAFISALSGAAVEQSSRSIEILRDSPSNYQGYKNQNETLSQYVTFMTIHLGEMMPLKCMLSGGEPIDAYDKTGMNMPLFAVMMKKNEILRCLLERGADANAPHAKAGTTPLIQAILHSNVEAVFMLLDHHANPNLCLPKSNLSPLHYAARLGVYPIIKALLEHGADPYSECSEGQTPLDYAVLGKDQSAIDVLEKVTRQVHVLT